MPHKGKGMDYKSTPGHPKPKPRGVVAKVDEAMMNRMPESFKQMHKKTGKKA